MGQAGYSGVLFVFGAIASASVFAVVVFVVNRLLAPASPSSAKATPFECGMTPEGDAWAPWRLRFSTIAMLFVLFDAEAVLLFAIVPALKGSPVAALEVGAFVGMLAAGLAYAWSRGALEWRS